MVLDPCVKRTFYNVRLTHVLHMVNVRCTFCCVVEKTRLHQPVDIRAMIRNHYLLCTSLCRCNVVNRHH